jgi:hypothetical protein
LPCVDNFSGLRAFVASSSISRTLNWVGASAVVLGLLAGCGSAPTSAPTQPVAPTPAPTGPAPVAPKPVAPKPATKAEEPKPSLPSAARVRSLEELRLLAAKRLVAANPNITYMGKPPELLLAIPVISIELNGDGSVKSISVLRHPSQALDTEEIAREAIMRAAPFGDVSALPKPWKFTETFLFNKERKFKPMTLDQLR